MLKSGEELNSVANGKCFCSLNKSVQYLNRYINLGFLLYLYLFIYLLQTVILENEELPKIFLDFLNVRHVPTLPKAESCG